MSNEVYDLAIIGAGPGGYHAAIRAAQYGAKVALIEKEELGGACLNWGCIPTKALYESSKLIQKIRDHGEDFGLICELKIDFGKAVERKNRIVKDLVKGIEALQRSWKNDVFKGYGKIISGDLDNGFEIAIEGESHDVFIKAKRIIIATGSSPKLIPSFNIDHDKILTSSDILHPEFKKVPKNLLVIGAGVIGCEFANIFATFGSKVTVLEYLPLPIATEEPMIIREIMNKFEKLGIDLHISQNVLSIENTGTGVKVITCSALIPNEEIESAEKSIYEADYCLISIGREKESSNIGLERIGIETIRNTIRVVPDTLETNIKGVYAIGDVTGGLMLAHVASYEGNVAVANALSSIGGFPIKPLTTDYSVVPSTIFTNPNIGSVGIRRADAKEKNIDVLMGRFTYASLGKAKCMGEDEGFIMVLANKENGKIIGASCIGVEAPELIAEIALAMKYGLTAHDVGNVIHSHPTISEVVLEGAEDVYGMAIHRRGRPRFI